MVKLLISSLSIFKQLFWSLLQGKISIFWVCTEIYYIHFGRICFLIFYGIYSFVYVSLFEEAVTSRLYGLILVTEVIIYVVWWERTVIQGLVIQGIKMQKAWWHQEGG